MSLNALFGRLVAAFAAALLMTAGAAADVVPLQGDALDPQGAAPADQWAAADDKSEPFAELLSAVPTDTGAQAPLLELMGLPARRVDRKRVVAYAMPGLVEQPVAASGRPTDRLANPMAWDETDDGDVALHRKALEFLEELEALADSPEPYGTPRQAFASGGEPPLPRGPSGPTELRRSWVRDGLLSLRANREWVVVGILGMLMGTFAIRRFGRPTGVAHAGARRPSRLAR